MELLDFNSKEIKFDIYFKDLNEDAQKELLEMFKTTEENENWDVFPLTTIYKTIGKDENEI